MSYRKCRCRICGDMHELTAENFPLELWVPPTDKKGNAILGKPPVFVGRACRKCDRKDRRDKFIKQHGIKPRRGQTLNDAIQDKASELKIKSKIVKDRAPNKKQGLFQRIQNRLMLGRQKKGK